MNDSISRQAAIDALFKKFDASTGVTWIPLEHIEQLPSAQPEHIKCRDCKEYYAHDHRCRWWNHGTNEAGWCYVAERREE